MPRGLNYDNKILSIVNVAVDMLILGIFWFAGECPGRVELDNDTQKA